MKNLILALFLMMSLIQSAPALATILQIDTMKSITRYIVPGTLIVFDLDNTVIEAAQTLGSDQWFDHVVASNKAQGMDADIAVQRAIQTWTQVQKVTKVRAVEASTPNLIRALQDRGYPVIALTARPDAVRAVTLKQLASVGVKIDHLFMIGPNLTKGEVLKRIVQQTGKIKRVAFVDDKQKHVETVNSSLNTLGNRVEHFEFRYGAADPKVKALDLKVVACEWGAFSRTGRIPSDLQCGGHPLPF